MAQASCAYSTPASALRARIMRRAWALFRQRYAYPAIPFASIGRLIETERNPASRVGIETRFWERPEDMVERQRRIGLYTAALDLAGAA